MKKIVITQRLIENNSYHEIRDALDIRWAELFMELDYLPILLPTNYDFEKYFESIEIGGIILSGGNDLGIWSEDKLSQKRDIFEKEIIKFAIKECIPILGICRGMQIIADYFNGEFEKVDGHVGTNHIILVSNNSEFKEYLKKLDYVNSYHNYGIREIPDGFIISAKGEDGTIEAMENKENNIFCQMWHTERQVPFNDNELMIIKKLFD
jgi:putative glutamine amidotransferase